MKIKSLIVFVDMRQLFIRFVLIGLYWRSALRNHWSATQWQAYCNAALIPLRGLE